MRRWEGLWTEQRLLHRMALLLQCLQVPLILSKNIANLSLAFTVLHLIYLYTYLYLLQEQKLCLILPLKNPLFLMLGSAVNSMCVVGYFELSMGTDN